MCRCCTNRPEREVDKPHPLTGPAYVGGFLLGLIGLVEVLGLVIDVLR